jgi:hypothetical protein
MKKLLVLLSLLCVGLLIVGCSSSEDLNSDEELISDEDLEKELNLLETEELESLAEESIDENSALAGEASRNFRHFKLTDGREAIVNSRFIKLSKEVFSSRLSLLPVSTCSSGCNDLDACYGNTNICQGTVLLVGENYGYLELPSKKSFVTRQQNDQYLSGSHACQVMYSKECIKIDIYSGGEWKIDPSHNCETSVSEGYDLSRIYRASCEGSISVTPPPPGGSVTGILNQ